VERSGIIHGFMTRSSDSIIRESAERQAFVDALGASAIVIMEQQHGDSIHVVEAGERPGTGDGLIISKRVSSA